MNFIAEVKKAADDVNADPSTSDLVAHVAALAGLSLELTDWSPQLASEWKTTTYLVDAIASGEVTSDDEADQWLVANMR
jgi:hypothetical protein